MREARWSSSWVAVLTVAALGTPALAGEPCALTAGCVADGECTEVAGRCVVASDADCQQSSECQRGGHCRFDATARSRCAIAGACAKTPGCKAFGVCHGEPDGCYESDEGCAASSWCADTGRCRATSGPSAGCVADSCEDTPGCARDGACAVIDAEDDRYCGAATTKMCMDSRGCARFGLCQKAPDGSYCRVSEGGCKRSAECRASGLCAVAGDHCAAADDPGCAASEACKKHGACRALSGVCVTPGEVGEGPCRLIELTGLTATATSEHKATPPYRFEAAQLVDRDLRTSWQPASKRGGVGEKLVLTLPRRARLARLDVGNGFQRRDMLGDLWLMNNRAGRVLVRAGGLTVAATLRRDGLGFEAVPLPAVTTDQVELEILSVDKGTRWNDLALSELRVYVCE